MDRSCPIPNVTVRPWDVCQLREDILGPLPGRTERCAHRRITAQPQPPRQDKQVLEEDISRLPVVVVGRNPQLWPRQTHNLRSEQTSCRQSQLSDSKWIRNRTAQCSMTQQSWVDDSSGYFSWAII